MSLYGPDASCQEEACSIPSPQSIVTLTVQRLVRSGDGGIWSVTAVDGAVGTHASTQPEPHPFTRFEARVLAGGGIATGSLLRDSPSRFGGDTDRLLPPESKAGDR